jgi:putative MATE family efflux protein
MSKAPLRTSATGPRGALYSGEEPQPPLFKVYGMFLVPMIISNILQALSGTINNIYIGQLLGVKAMAAVSSFFPIFFFMISFMIGLGAGAAVLIGQAWGAKEPDRVKAIAGTTLMVGLYLGLFVAVLGGLLTEPLLKAMNTPSDVLGMSIEYSRIMLIAAPGLFLFLLITSMMRGVGDNTTSLKTLVLSTAASLLLTPAMILGWGGLPKLGIASGAYAAVISLALALGWTAWYMLKNKHPLAPDASLRKHLRIDRAILSRVVRIGLPTAIAIITSSLSELAVLFFMNGHGSQATAAYGAVNQVFAYVKFPAISIAITASILGAQAIGAGRGQSLGKIAQTGIVLNLLLTGFLVLLGYAFSRAVIGLFITDQAAVEIAQSILHVMLWSLVVFGMGALLSGVMRASGTVLVPTLITLLSVLVVQIPAAWVLDRHWGLLGVAASYPVAYTFMLVMQASYYQMVWKKKPIRRL